jgi:CheY-like chemotaxis protein
MGSRFTATIPILYPELETAPSWQVDPNRVPVLVVEDEPEAILVYEKFLAGGGFQVLPARTLRQAENALASVRPRAIILDILLRGEDGWRFLTELKRRPDTVPIPVVVITTVEDESKCLALGADAYCLKPIDRQRLLQTLTRLTAPETMRRVLLVDDEEISRYLLRQHLAPQHVVSEAASGDEALRLAREQRPDVICLDLVMPGLDGFAVLRALKNDPTTRHIPVVIVTSKPLDDTERGRLLELASTILPKDAVSPEGTLAAVERAMRLGDAA